jgi:beta-lactamase regulating signal transducer with metallopeptidase domain
MIATWMLYCALCALGLSAAATLAERALLAARGPVRAVWFSAVALSLLVPGGALRYGSRTAKLPSALVSQQVANTATNGLANSAATQQVDRTSVAESVAPSLTRPLSTSAMAVRARWVALVSRADRPLAYTWLALSTLLALYFVGGMTALAVMRRSWRRDLVLDVPVLISERTGPALVGVIAPAIVVPEWALAMDASQLGLMLRHEQEHRRARDSQLLTLAHVALVVMPWNVALWWQIRQLRAAVEMDCDARVLQHADPRSYGDLLLEVVRPGRGLRLMGATAFAERATQLERRIRVMARRRQGASHGARAIAVSIALSALSVAWIAPRPASPAIPPASPTHDASARVAAASQPNGSVSAPTIGGARQDKAESAEPVTTADPTAREGSTSVYPTAAQAALFASELSSLQRFGTMGVVNPMLMLLRASDSLKLSAPQADSIATLNRWYMVQLIGIWSPVISRYAAQGGDWSVRTPDPSIGRAAEESMKVLARLSPRIEALLTADQRQQLPAAIAADLDVVRLAAIGASQPGAGSVFAPDGGLGNGRGGRGRIGGPGR